MEDIILLGILPKILPMLTAMEKKRRHHHHSHGESHHREQRHHQEALPYFQTVKVPSFSGDSDPNVYLDWEAKCEQIFKAYESMKTKR